MMDGWRLNADDSVSVPLFIWFCDPGATISVTLSRVAREKAAKARYDI